MKIAIIGAGLSGLATGWFLLNQPQHQKISLTFFDPLEIGKGTSGMAGGLLHPYAGASAKLNRQGLEGYQASSKLLHLISKKLGKSVICGQGLLRLAITDQQKKEFHLSSERHDQIHWMSGIESAQRFPPMSFHPGIFINECITVNCPLYLDGLWQACEEKGAAFENTGILSLENLENFDQIVLATGASVNQLLPALLPVTPVKGQILELTWPADLPPLTFALNSQAYLLMDQKKHTCIVGATYERNFDSLLPNSDVAVRDILPKAVALVPSLGNAAIIDCKAGVRASTPDHMPIIQKVNAKCWVITGMGSKGLLYHALYAEKLSQMILKPVNAT